jgi:hypothetical protein
MKIIMKEQEEIIERDTQLITDLRATLNTALKAIAELTGGAE